MDASMVTTANNLEGYRITRYLGVVRGITVRSRSVLGNMAGGIQAMFGGNITIYTELCEHARSEAFELMVQHAQQQGANAIIGVRYDANDVMEGITPVERKNFVNVQIDAIGIGLASAAAPFLPVFLTRLGASNLQVGLLTSMPAMTGVVIALFVCRFVQ